MIEPCERYIHPIWSFLYQDLFIKFFYYQLANTCFLRNSNKSGFTRLANKCSKFTEIFESRNFYHKKFPNDLRLIYTN